MQNKTTAKQDHRRKMIFKNNTPCPGGRKNLLMASLVILQLGTMCFTALGQAVTEKSGVSLSKASKLDQFQAGYYRMMVGDVPVTALSDGTVGLDILNGILLNAKSGEVEKLLAYDYQKSPISASVNAFLIRIEGKYILVDAGSGELLGPTANKLPESLRAVGVEPEQISDIFATHIHPDHTGGLMDGDRRVFPKATVHVDKREIDYWLDKSLAEKATEPIKTFFSQAELKIRPYISSGQLKTFDGATQFFPGFRSQPAYGHTPGHTFYILESGGEKALFAGDLMHIGPVQFEDPLVAIKFDSDPVKAVEQRKREFADAAKTGYLVAFAHISFPGVGRIREDGDHYRWIPVPYVNDAAKPAQKP
jgi:glyoxylase-like metal-dependent hydrolase (beta-lactamase superfamily II)